MSVSIPIHVLKKVTILKLSDSYFSNTEIIVTLQKKLCSKLKENFQLDFVGKSEYLGLGQPRRAGSAKKRCYYNTNQANIRRNNKEEEKIWSKCSKGHSRNQTYLQFLVSLPF